MPGNTSALPQMAQTLSDGQDQGELGHNEMQIERNEDHCDQHNNSTNVEDYELYFRSIINQETAVVKLKPNLYTIIDYSNPLIISPVRSIFSLSKLI
jgi:hypothetical protein